MKGAIEIILDKSSHILTDNGVKALDNSKKEILNSAREFASKGLRVLAIAYRELEDKPRKISSEQIEKDLIFIGFVAMIDPPRKEVCNAVKLAKKAAIKVIMITGDQKETAVYIAKEVGIMSGGDLAITGDDLSKMSDEELIQ